MHHVNRSVYRDVLVERETRALNAAGIKERVPLCRKLSTIEFEVNIGSSELNLQNVIADILEAAQPELMDLKNKGYLPFLFQMSATLSPAEAKELFAPRVLRSVTSKHRQMLGNGRGVEQRSETETSVKSAALLPLSWSALVEAVLYSNMRPHSLIMLSQRQEFCSDENLKHIFPLASIHFDGTLSNEVNEGLISALLCPLGDVVMKVHGEFDDPERDLQLIFDPEMLPQFVNSIVQ